MCLEIRIIQWYLTIHNLDLHWNTCTLHQKNNPENQTFAWLAFSLSPCTVRFFTGRNFQRFMASSMSTWLKLILPAILLRCLLLPLQLYRSTDFEVHRTGELCRGQGGEQKRAMLRNVEQLLEQQDLRELSFEGWLMIRSQWYTQTRHSITAKLFKLKVILLLIYIIYFGGLAGCQEDTSESSPESKDKFYDVLLIQDLRTWRNWLAITYQLPISVAQLWKNNFVRLFEFKKVGLWLPSTQVSMM